MTDRGRAGESGPVPVRDLLKQLAGEPAEEERAAEATGPAADASSTEGAAGQGPVEFEMADEEWIALAAGTGAYGTGGRGRARLLAVHFIRAADPDRPVREALIPASQFGSLRASELRELFERATPIELDREGS